MKDGRNLCCLVNPLNENGVVKWCTYCKKGICDKCLDKFAVNNYFHHERCAEICSHKEEHRPVVRG